MFGRVADQTKILYDNGNVKVLAIKKKPGCMVVGSEPATIPESWFSESYTKLLGGRTEITKKDTKNMNVSTGLFMLH